MSVSAGEDESATPPTESKFSGFVIETVLAARIPRVEAIYPDDCAREMVMTVSLSLFLSFLAQSRSYIPARSIAYNAEGPPARLVGHVITRLPPPSGRRRKHADTLAVAAGEDTKQKRSDSRLCRRFSRAATIALSWGGRARGFTKYNRKRKPPATATTRPKNGVR
ncbi:hypothetical protein MRX96_029525 [Rhipicephalus microplus]